MNRGAEALRIAVCDMRLNALRSLLSLSGVVIGIASVTAILTLGSAVRDLVRERLSAEGVLEYQVRVGFDPKSLRLGTLTEEDAERLAGLPIAAAVYPELRVRAASVRSARGASRAQVLGLDWSALRARRLGSKGPPLPPEAAERARACLLTAAAAEELFPAGGAVGGEVRVDASAWTVAGVLPTEGGSPLDPLGRGEKAVLLPYRAASRLDAESEIARIVVRVPPRWSAGAAALIARALERGEPQRKGLYQVLDPAALLDQRPLRVATWIGAIIAVISLFVGEVGLMNVMLTSVAERTREIGLRRALGARRLDILVQFLVESGLLSALGGLLGLFLGLLLARLVGAALASPGLDGLVLRPGPGLLLSGLAGSTLLGTVFGLYPACAAARLSPAEALRAE